MTTVDMSTVLVVDDEKEIADLVQITFKRGIPGSEYRQCRRGRRSVYCAASPPPHSDIMMPGKDGMTLCREPGKAPHIRC